jgi:hypothetical protein
VVLFDQLGPPGGTQRCSLRKIRTQIDQTRSKLLLIIDGMKF